MYLCMLCNGHIAYISRINYYYYFYYYGITYQHAKYMFIYNYCV